MAGGGQHSQPLHTQLCAQVGGGGEGEFLKKTINNTFSFHYLFQGGENICISDNLCEVTIRHTLA